MNRSNINQAQPATESQFQPVDLRSFELASEFYGGQVPSQALSNGGTVTATPSDRVRLSGRSDKAKAQNVRPAIIRPAPAGTAAQPTGGIVRQDGPALSNLRPQQRLQPYVRQLEDLHPQKRTVDTTTKAVDVAQTLAPSGKTTSKVADQKAMGNIESAALSKSSFVSTTDFSSAENTWGTPKIFTTIELSKSVMPNQPKADRIDTSHLDGCEQKTHLVFQPEPDQREAEPLAVEPAKKPARELTFNEQAVLLNDPQTQDLVALISSAIASVLNDEPEEEVMPQAKSLFDESLQKHAVLLEEDQVSSETLDHGISDAMVDSIAAQRETTAHISETVPPSTLANQLRQKIAMHQKAQMKHASVIETAEIELTTAATDAGQAEAIEMDGTGSHAIGKGQQAGTDQSADVADEAPPIVSFARPEEAMIPLSAAAWDVEDFRWPAVADQMIVDGGEAIGQLLKATLVQTPGASKKSAISGAGRTQGTTTISITWARWAAACGLKTLIVDADVANPSLSGRVGLSSNLSWLNGINKEMPSSELIIRSRKTNLCLMPLASTVTRVTWPRFIFDNLGQILAPVSEHFDLILVDAGPASQLLDELSNPKLMVDGVVLVDSNASAKELDVYQTRLTTFGIESLVVAENRKAQPASNVA